MYPNVLVHRSDARKDHKYVARVKMKSKSNFKKNTYRYFYSLKEYRAYLKEQENSGDKKQPTNNKKETNKKISELVSKGSSILDRIVKKTDTALDKKISKGKKKVDNILKSSEKKATKITKNSKEKLSKYVSKGKAAVDKMVTKNDKFVKKKTNVAKVDKKSVSKGKDFVKKHIDKTEVGFAVIVPKSLVKKAMKFVADVFTKEKDNKNKSSDKGTKSTDLKVKLPNGKYKKFDDVDEYEDYQERLEYQKNEPDFMKKVKDIAHDDVFTKREDMDKVNETYDPFDDDTSANCANCSAAYELRRRGYDVEAKANGTSEEYNGRGDRVFDYFDGATLLGINGDGSTIEYSEKFCRDVWDGKLTEIDAKLKYSELYNQMTTKQSYTPKTIEKAITANNPPGSRGMIDVQWKMGGGHSIVYEVNTNGSVTIRDSQTYEEYSLNELADSVRLIHIARTDNLQLKEDILDAVVTNKDKKRVYGG